MYKYEFKIDGNPYKALFTSRSDAEIFIAENQADGSVIVVIKSFCVSPLQAFLDDDFGETYASELIAEYLGMNVDGLNAWDIAELIKAHFEH